MAELLIYKGPNWMDDLTQEQLAEYVKKFPNFMDRYNARNRPGDIIDVKPDGFWDKRGHGKEKFYVVKVPNLDFERAKTLTLPELDGEALLKKRKYKADVESLTFDIDSKTTVPNLPSAKIYDKTTDKQVTVLSK